MIMIEKTTTPEGFYNNTFNTGALYPITVAFFTRLLETRPDWETEWVAMSQAQPFFCLISQAQPNALNLCND